MKDVKLGDENVGTVNYGIKALRIRTTLSTPNEWCT